MRTLTHFLRRFGIHRQDAGHIGAAARVDLADVEFRVPNMVCEGCAETMDGVLHEIPGVREIRPNVSQKGILVRYEPARVDPQRLRDGLVGAGFTPVVEVERS